MEDILKFLLVAGVLVVAFIRQAKKEAQKKQTSLPPFMPQPEAPSAPLPDEPKDRTYDGYIPEEPAPEPAAPPRPKAKRKAAQTFAKAKPKQNIAAASPSVATPDTENDASDYNIRSAEEARRAIIWGEILNRKY
ncbi:MAG TPA: hypothetical protein H9824_08160 [Candidatus Bacteroides pullicola]|uniref:Ferrichrome ABC transporter substrate-binding protein n=1 Tax=Candidatus Bacteroides pullicola TaxID=2838475 RepID=A0A9D2CLP7_9BACE|nr:hypothetical protein [Candidatus Bacteroides pullicola]